MLFYKRYYYRFGIRKAEHLLSPPIHFIQDLSLPRYSVLHYLPDNSAISGMPGNHWTLQQAERLAMGVHVTEHHPSATEGKARLTGMVPQTEVLAYHKKNKKVRIVRNLATNLKHPKTLLVVNYGILNLRYRYPEGVFSQLHRMNNLLVTLWHSVNQYAQELPDRFHYLSVDLPTPIPTLTLIRRASGGINRNLLPSFNNLESLILLDLWKWLGKDREQSYLNAVDKSILDKVNFIIKHDNRWITFNLATLDNWRKELDEDLAQEDEGNIKPDMLQKRFLRILMSLFESTTLVEEKTEEEDLKEVKAEAPLPVEDEDSDVDDSLVEVVEENPVEEKQRFKRVMVGIKGTSEELEKELDTQVAVAEEVIPEAVFEEGVKPLEDNYLNKAETLLHEGLISPAEYRRFEKLAKGYKELPNPYTGKGSLSELSKVTPEELAIKSVELPVGKGVLDTSMAKTTLMDFDKKYIEQVLKKDVVNSVVNLTRAGIAIDKYEVDTIEDISGAYESHTVRLVPVTGKPSTLHFRIPVIDPDGSFIANGVKYKMRKQRGD